MENDYVKIFLARVSNYAPAGKGYCNDWVFLPEGAYPELLNLDHPLYNKDRIQECMNRCVDAAKQGLHGYRRSGDTTIRNSAFYLNSDLRCGCSSGACSTRTTQGYSGYRSYLTVSGMYQTFM